MAAGLLLIAAWPTYEAWRVARFQRIRRGMTQAEVLQLLGPPTSRSRSQCLREENCPPGPCWLYRQHIFEHLVIHFDAMGRVTCSDVYRPEIRLSG